MLEKLPTIKLYRGATSVVEFDFSEFDFKGGKCEFTLTNLCENKTITKYEFSESKKYLVVFKDEFTSTLENSNYKYNIMHLLENERYPQCLDSDVTVERVINSYESEN